MAKGFLPFSKTVNREARDGYLLLGPLLTVVSVFILLPVIGTLVNSFYNDVSFLPRRFAGLENYSRIFQDPGFFQSLRFTLLFLLVSVPLEMGLGILFAVLLNAAIPGRGFVRAAVLIPWAIPAAISARVWELVYNFSYGLANAMIEPVFGEPVNFLGTTAGAFSALVVADVWKTTPFIAVIVLAGLQTIPREMYEQARIDGASSARTFFQVVLPLLRPVLIVALLFRTVDAIRIFDVIFVLTGGGPGGSTSSISHYAYKFFLSGDFGYGSAVSVIVFAAAFMLSIVYVKAGRFGEEAA